MPISQSPRSNRDPGGGSPAGKARSARKISTGKALRYGVLSLVCAGLAIFVYLGATSVVYRITGINFRVSNLPELYRVLQTYQDDRVYNSMVKRFMENGGGFMRYFLYDEPGDVVARYAAHKDAFLPVEDLRLKKFCGPEENALRDGRYIQYGARVAVLPDIDGDALPDLIGVSYLGSKPALHEERHFSAVHLSRHFNAVNGQTLRSHAESGLFEWFFRDKSYRDLNAGSYFRPFGYNALDLDGDRRSDFLIGDTLVLASGLVEGHDGPTLGEDATTFEVGADSIFLRSQGDVLLASLLENSLVLRAWDPESRSLRSLGEQELALEADEPLAYRLMPLPDLNGDRHDDMAVKHAGRVTVLLSRQDRSDGGLTFDPRWTLTGLERGRGHVIVGGFGDFDGDDAEDFWVAQSGFEADGQRVGRAFLITGQGLRSADPGGHAVDAIADLTLLGSPAYSNVDGIGATLSLRAGDLDGDGLDDFSISGHHHLDESGALYVLFGKDLRLGAEIDITDPGILKIRGNELTQLAPLPAHWDASDYDGDGFDDIVVTADNDFCSGFATGAIYILSGWKTMQRWHALPGRQATLQ